MHWDMQLFKALEHQYQVGLEGLHQDLKEIPVKLTFEGRKLQVPCAVPVALPIWS